MFPTYEIARVLGGGGDLNLWTCSGEARSIGDGDRGAGGRLAADFSITNVSLVSFTIVVRWTLVLVRRWLPSILQLPLLVSLTRVSGIHNKNHGFQKIPCRLVTKKKIHNFGYLKSQKLRWLEIKRRLLKLKDKVEIWMLITEILQWLTTNLGNSRAAVVSDCSSMAFRQAIIFALLKEN